jgi:hypothetical protein
MQLIITTSPDLFLFLPLQASQNTELPQLRIAVVVRKSDYIKLCDTNLCNITKSIIELTKDTIFDNSRKQECMLTRYNSENISRIKQSLLVFMMKQRIVRYYIV